jgi:hypothetical protein
MLALPAITVLMHWVVWLLLHNADAVLSEFWEFEIEKSMLELRHRIFFQFNLEDSKLTHAYLCPYFPSLAVTSVASKSSFILLPRSKNSFKSQSHLHYYCREEKLTTYQDAGWMVALRGRSSVANTTPLASLIFNFPRPHGEQPALLSYSELHLLFRKVCYLHSSSEILVSVYSSNPKMETTGSSEALVPFYKTTRCHIFTAVRT